MGAVSPRFPLGASIHRTKEGGTCPTIQAPPSRGRKFRPGLVSVPTIELGLAPQVEQDISGRRDGLGRSF
jgi:hypothetical protein